jgi:AraC-like DNA-binding protein
MPQQLTALASLARTALDAAAKAGVTTEALLLRTGLDHEALCDLDGRIAVVDLLRLWDTAAEMSGDPFFGLHAGERVVSARTVHVVGYAARNSASLGECYANTARFASLTNEGSEIEALRKGRRGIVIVGPKPGLPVWPRVYAEMAIAAYLCVGRRWTGVALQPLVVEFQHARPADVSEYDRLFACELRFGAPQNQLVLPAPVFDLPLATIDPDLLAYFEEKASSLLDDVGGATLEQRAREVIAKLLGGSQPPTLASVAPRLALSTRTLQRRLGEDGLVFGDLVDDVRRITALRLMSTRDFDLAIVALRVGYRDLDAFRAAFQRWTGKTPRDHRAGLVSAGQA